MTSPSGAILNTNYFRSHTGAQVLLTSVLTFTLLLQRVWWNEEMKFWNEVLNEVVVIGRVVR